MTMFIWGFLTCAVLDLAVVILLRRQFIRALDGLDTWRMLRKA